MLLSSNLQIDMFHFSLNVIKFVFNLNALQRASRARQNIDRIQELREFALHLLLKKSRQSKLCNRYWQELN